MAKTSFDKEYQGFLSEIKILSWAGALIFEAEYTKYIRQCVFFPATLPLTWRQIYSGMNLGVPGMNLGGRIDRLEYFIFRRGGLEDKQTEIPTRQQCLR